MFELVSSGASGVGQDKQIIEWASALRERGREREREGLVEAAARDLEGCRGFKGLNNGLKAGKRQA